MGGSRQATALGRSRRDFASDFDLLESKLTPPFTRPGTVVRTRLVNRLRTSRAVPVVTVVAPPGYGKTTLMAEWQEADDRPFAWLSLEESDNDPVALLTYIAVALDRSEPVDPLVFSSLSTRAAPVDARVIPRLGSVLGRRDSPVVLVLDDAHRLTNVECIGALVGLSRHLSSGSQLVLAGRQQPGIPSARLRSQGQLLELGMNDLALDLEGAASLVRGTGLGLDRTEIEELHRETEGWPAGLYLASLSLRAQQSNGSRPHFEGGDRFVVDYMWSELLSRLTSGEVEFLTRTSVLDRMCGPLCDAVLERSDASGMLQELERSNRFVIPLDRHRNWYRYHHLFREVLATELSRREAESVPELHTRAARWHEANGMPEEALGHALAGGDTRDATLLFIQLAASLIRQGRLVTVRRWVERFPEEAFERDASLAASVAWAAVLSGDPASADEWAGVVERHLNGDDPSEDPTTLVAPRRLLLVAMCRRGMKQMLGDAKVALSEQPSNGPWRAMALLGLAVATLFNGDSQSTDTILAEAAEVGERTGASPVRSIALAERSLLAMSRHDWGPACAYAERAAHAVEAAGLEEYVTSAITYAASARCAIRQGDLARARTELTRAQRLRPIMTRTMPWFAVQTRLELARVNFALSDRAGARMLLSEITDILARQPDLGTLVDEVAGLRQMLDARHGGGVPGPSALTTAELRLLNLLPTHLSFPEIGQRLYISPNTVKTQAISIYRKLGASSRSAAVEAARRIGIIDF